VVALYIVAYVIIVHVRNVAVMFSKDGIMAHVQDGAVLTARFSRNGNRATRIAWYICARVHQCRHHAVARVVECCGTAAVLITRCGEKVSCRLRGMAAVHIARFAYRRTELLCSLNVFERNRSYFASSRQLDTELFHNAILTSVLKACRDQDSGIQR
jgi:hypothetical protein